MIVPRISLLSICILVIVAKFRVLLSVGKHLMAGSSSNRRGVYFSRPLVQVPARFQRILNAANMHLPYC
jgi:hypothetical protein